MPAGNLWTGWENGLVFHRLAGDVLSLEGRLLQQVAGWNQMLAEAGPHVRNGLIENTGDLMQPGDVILIVFDRAESCARG